METNSNDKKTMPDYAVMKFVLTSFFGAHIEDVMNEYGDMEKCVCIPLDRNELRVGSTGKVNAYAFVVKTMNANQYGWTHFLRLKSSPGFSQKMKDLGYKMPYIGNLKPSNRIAYKDEYKKAFVPKNLKWEDIE